MSNPHADQQTFRAWLVKQLTLTRWSLPLRAGEEESSRLLGVRVDVLREAAAARDAELKRRGKGGIARGKRRYVGHDYAALEVRMPPPIWKIWLELCGLLQIEAGTVFRSLIHHFLLRPERPKTTARTWVYRGQIYPLTHDRQVRRPRCRVTRGAQMALDTHADSWNVTPTALMRGLLTEFLEGRTKQLKIVSFGELWGDPERYLHPEKFP